MSKELSDNILRMGNE